MKDIEIFCDYFYKDSFIPIYIYNKQNLITCYPPQNALTHPPESYLEKLWKQDVSLSYITTNFYSFFGCIQLMDSPDIRLVIGPVNNVPYSSEILHTMYREYIVAANDRKDFDGFFKNTAALTLTSFLAKLIFINYSLNKITLALSDILDVNQPAAAADIPHKYMENLYISKENGSFNNSYDIEKALISIIENGNLKGFNNFISNPNIINEGIIAANALRQQKNTTIVMITLATRAAIRGGLPTETAFQLSDLYIQQLEQLTSIENIYKLNYQAIYDFTYRVANSQVPITKDDVIQKAIYFVLKNTNSHLSVTEVSNHVGFSRSYFTHRFKKELGFDLSAFILRCKLEEAKYLLAYTDKSISDISNYLCFSSQSHFQTQFKKQYHITPLEYRKHPQKY